MNYPPFLFSFSEYPRTCVDTASLDGDHPEYLVLLPTYFNYFLRWRSTFLPLLQTPSDLVIPALSQGTLLISLFERNSFDFSTLLIKPSQLNHGKWISWGTILQLFPCPTGPSANHPFPYAGEGKDWTTLLPHARGWYIDFAWRNTIASITQPSHIVQTIHTAIEC